MTRDWFLSFLLVCSFFSTLSATHLQLVCTESDPDAFIQDSVNVINGQYCESATDLTIAGPDALLLQRFYHSCDYLTGTQSGGWRILTQRFLVLGKDSKHASCTAKDHLEGTTAFLGERSGGILPYSGWRNANGETKDPLKIDGLNDAIGMVNTYAKEINGQNNHQNNLLYCKGNTCELTLGDGTKRIYQKVEHFPSQVLGEELTPLMALQVIEPEYFLLSQEILPSGNQLFFSYDPQGHLISMDMKNKSEKKIISWIHFSYDFQEDGCVVQMNTSDVKTLTYHFTLVNSTYQLKKVEGSHVYPIAYEYEGILIKKKLPEGRFINVTYQDGKVKSLKKPHPLTGQEEITHSFSYGDGYTDVFDALGTKTRYIYDKRLQLTTIQCYDDQNTLYRTEQKFWGRTTADAGLLLAKTIGDGNGCIHSYRAFIYDKGGNVVEEQLYGNLTGKSEVFLQITPEGKLLNAENEECHRKTFGYSSDGFNLLTKMGDCKGNQTLYIYKPGTNLLIKKLIYDRAFIKNRTFHTYNDDGVCIKTIEDDGSEEKENIIYGWGVTERHIKEIKPKETLPGVGLPEVIEEKALDLKTKQDILIKKLVNTYDDQSNLLTCSTYDANGHFAYIESRTYNALGQVISEVDAAQREICYTYDGIGNQTSVSIPYKNQFITMLYDLHNQPIEITNIIPEELFTLHNTYDALGRKICSIDRFSNATLYEYDPFNRLTKVIYPEVLDEHEQHINPTFTYTYDIFGHVLTTQDPKGFVTSKRYNLRGSPTKISYPDGSFELLKYDKEGSLHRSLTKEQIITVYEYDYLGRSVYEEDSSSCQTGTGTFLISRSHQYNGFRCISEREDNLVKSYSYDPAGRLSSIIEHQEGKMAFDPESRRIDIIYDPLSRICQKKVWFDVGSQDYSFECFEYDILGNRLEKRIKDSQGNILLRRGFSYNTQGQCVEEYHLENGNTTSLLQTFYNSEGDPIGYLDGLGQETKVIIDHSYQNALGQKVLKKTLVNPIGVQTIIEFDALSRISAISKKDPMGILLSSQKNLYDPLGNKSCEIHDQIVEGKIVGTQKIRWTYGPMGRLEEEIQAAGSPLEKQTHYVYNSLGKMTDKIIQGATPIHYTYNKDGRLHKIQAQGSKKELEISNSYSYDRKGNIKSAYSLHGKSVERHYNAFNQVTEETIKDGEGLYFLEYAYDRKGRLKEIILPGKSKIVYTYDAVFGREVKRLSAKEEVLYSHTYDHYDEQGRSLSETAIGNLGSQEYTYDLAGHKISTKCDCLNEQYTRDALGRVIKIEGAHQEDYVYNDLSQLVSEKKHQSHSYLYDSLDNRLKMNAEELAVNALNQLTSNSRAGFSYDPQGNLLRKILNGEETRFEHNPLSQLTSIEKSDKTALTFSYDPFGRLLVEKHLDIKGKNKKTLSKTRYLYLGHQEIGTLTEKGNIETLKVPGLHGDTISSTSIVFEIKGQLYVPIHDIAGNVTGLIDSQTQQPVEHYHYTAFGEEIMYNASGEVVESSVVSNPWRYAEKRIDPKSGLILFGFRFYDPTMGKWISQDPAGFVDGPNLYAYVHNNPLNYLDRFGLESESNSANVSESYMYGEVESHCFCQKHRTCKRGGDIGKTTSSCLPKVTYCECFEDRYCYESDEAFWAAVDRGDEFRPHYDRSRTYDLGLPELPDGMEIGFINGIDNSFEEARKSATYISRLSGGYNVHAVYNATHGKMVDGLECNLGLNYIATDPVRQLHSMWNSFFERSAKDAKFLMICHSQGAIHVRNALLDYPPELRERILVVAIAPGGYIYEETCAQVVHVRAHWSRDLVPYFDKKGTKRAKRTIIELNSHQEAPWHDHEFMSPTYHDELLRRINNFIKTKGNEI